LDGGVFYLSATTSVEITATKTTFSNNVAGFSGTAGNGGVFAIYAATTNVDLTLLSCTLDTNKASGGSGGFIYVDSSSASSIVTITSSILNSN
jgi:hypothetical protein